MKTDLPPSAGLSLLQRVVGVSLRALVRVDEAHERGTDVAQRLRETAAPALLPRPRRSFDEL